MTKPAGQLHTGKSPAVDAPTAAPRVILIDNYDSFTYNLVQLLGVLGAEVLVRRNDELAPAEAAQLGATHLVISPGPGGPREAGVSMSMIEAFAGKLPMMGVCLGHQAIAEVFGGKVARAATLMHGKSSVITHDGTGVFEGLPREMVVGRYHSLSIEPGGMPPGFVVTARSRDGEVMGIRHERLAISGVQFHPESVLTPDGPKLMENFLAMRCG